MKVRKDVTLDLEIILRLQKEKNASGLVNELLIKYFQEKDDS